MRDVLVAVAYFPLHRFVAYVHSASKHPRSSVTGYLVCLF